MPQFTRINLSSSSTVDWCEENYAYTSYIAEFWNTLSSLSLAYAGYVGYKQHKQYNGSIVYLVLAFVGVGSVFFHGTLTAATQMLDEIPMVFLVLQLSLNILQVQRLITKLCSYLGACLFSLFIYKTAFLEDSKTLEDDSDYGRKRVEFYIFQSSIISMGVFIFRQLLSKLRSAKRRNRILIMKGCGTFLLGWVCWLVDYFLCSSMKSYGNPQLHAWWHVFSAISIYQLSLVSIVLANPTLDLTLESKRKVFLGFRLPVVLDTLVIDKSL